MVETRMIPITSVVVRAGRGRKEFKDIRALAESIKANDLIQPISVVKLEDDRFELIAGERRYRAHILAEKTEIRASIWEEMSPLKRKELELEENIQRCDLNWGERIELLKQIDELKRTVAAEKWQAGTPTNWSFADTAKLVGASEASVRQDIRLAEKLRARPELVEMVKKLPKKVAAKKIAQIEKSEEVAKELASGKIVGSASLLLGDCTLLIKQVQDESVDLILTDPPFGIPKLQRETARSIASYQATLAKEDNSDVETLTKVFQKLIPELYRVLKPGGHFYLFFQFDIYSLLTQLLRTTGFYCDPVPLIWYKDRITSPFTGNSYSSCYEPVLWGYKGQEPRYLAKPCSKLLTFKTIHSGAKLHPFEKPKELLTYLIEQSSEKGELVLDPFAGSASTLLAAKDALRKSLGFELNEDHFNRAQGRLLA